MASRTGRRVRPEAAAGIAVGIVALTAAGALAIGNGAGGDRPPGLQHPRGQEQAAWARDHEGPPPWARGGGRDKADRRHGPPPWAHDDDKGPGKSDKAKEKNKDRDDR